jgi:alkylation response protein AidB-like acyl-CoA dehydrogenase
LALLERDLRTGQTDNEQLLRDVDEFCKELRPIEEEHYVEHSYNDQLIPLCKKYDLMGIPIDKKYGGRGADAMTYTKALERVGMEGSGIRTFFSGHTSIGQVPIQLWGEEGQKTKYLPPSIRGDKIMAFGLTEPDAGSNPLELKMNYEENGGKFVLNGTKYLISNAGIANTIVTFAYPKEGGRMSAFIVDTTEIDDEDEIMRQDLTTKLGMPTTNTGLFELHDFPVAKGNLLGKEGDGFKIAMSTLMSGRLSVAAGCVGVMADCLVEATRYSKERNQHGKPIGKHQLVQEHIAMMKVELDAARLMVYEAARLKDEYNLDTSNREIRDKADAMIAEAKLYAANAAWDSADRAVQIFGGRGWSYLFRPGRHLQDVRVCRIYEGTDEIMKLKIASSVLGKEFESYH